MYDYLSKYHLSDSEREWVLMTVIKRLYEIGRLPKWLHKRRNLRTWGRLKSLYGEDAVRNTFHTLHEMGLTTNENRLVVLNERGKAVRKRGWVETKINKIDYNKWSLILSSLALIVSFFNGHYSWVFIKWVLHILLE